MNNLDFEYPLPENVRYIPLPESKYPPVPGRFEVIKLLWSERFLWVYEVRDRQAGRMARLWVEQVFSDFEQHHNRAVGLLQLNHPNLWQVYDSFEYTRSYFRYRATLAITPDPTFLPLRTLLAGPVSVRVAGQIFRQLAPVLIYCHSRKIIHGHLQPAFVWINRSGTVRLEMFAALPRPEVKMQIPGPDLDSPNGFLSMAYASPEQLIKTSTFDPRVDVYALGLITYELLAGFNPFLGNSDFSSLVRQTYKAPPPLSKVNPTTGPGLEAAIAGALVKNPEGRYPTVLDFLSQFEIGLVNDLQRGDSPPAYQTMPQLLEQAHSMTVEAMDFPAHFPAPPAPSAPGPERPVNQPPGPEPPEPAFVPPSPKIEQPRPRPQQEVPPVKPAVVRPRAVVTPARRSPSTVEPSRSLKTFPIVPVILVLNLIFMAFLSWALLNRSNSVSPVPTSVNPRPEGTFAYPTIDPLEQTRLAQAATSQAQPGFLISPTPPDLTLSAETVSPENTVSPASLAPDTVPSPDSTEGLPTASPPPAPTPGETTTIGPPGAGPVFNFSLPDSFAAEADTSANPQAAADRSFFEQGKAQDALATYQADLTRNPADEATLRRLGRLLFLWDHPTQPDAITLLEKAVSLNANDALGWAYLAFAYFGNHEYSKGAAASSQAVTLAPGLPEAMAANALSLFYAGQPSVAVGEITRVTGLNSSNPNFWVYLARYKIVRADGDLSGALTLIDILIQGSPGLTGFNCAKSEILWTLGPGNYAEAQSLLQKALPLDPTLSCLHANQGWVYYLQGNQNQAEKEFQLALQNNPSDVLALTGTGYILLDRKDYSGAQTVLQKALRLEPANGRALNGMAVASLNLGDNAAALEFAQKARQALPDYPDAYYNAGLAYYRLNNFQEAADSLQQAVRLSPTNASYLEALAFAFYRLQDFPQARQAAQASLALQPDNPSLQDLLKELGTA